MCSEQRIEYPVVAFKNFIQKADVRLGDYLPVPEAINELADDILCQLRRNEITVSDRKYLNYYPCHAPDVIYLVLHGIDTHTVQLRLHNSPVGRLAVKQTFRPRGGRN